ADEVIENAVYCGAGVRSWHCTFFAAAQQIRHSLVGLQPDIILTVGLCGLCPCQRRRNQAFPAVLGQNPVPWLHPGYISGTLKRTEVRAGPWAAASRAAGVGSSKLPTFPGRQGTLRGLRKPREMGISLAFRKPWRWRSEWARSGQI